MVNTNGLEAVGQTPFGEVAVNVSVKVPVCPVAGVYIVAGVEVELNVPNPFEEVHCNEL